MKTSASARLSLLLPALMAAEAWAAPLFDPSGPAIRNLAIEVSSAAAESLRKRPREYVRASLTVDDRPALTVGVHLKGSTGSFRPFDDRPGLTLDLDRFQGGQELDGYTKLHLNNSVEDPSRLSEWLGNDLFTLAGVPSPQVAHARVHLNGRDLGIFVLKEGFSAAFVRRSFPGSSGSVWEPQAGQDVPFDIADVLPKPGAPTVPAQLAERVDLDAFSRFIAVEVLLAHRDGYALARNNFRLFRPTGGGPMVFVPHGMDQLFATPTSPWRPQFAGEVARTWVATAEGAERYEASLRKLLPVLLDVPRLTNRLQTHADRLRPHLSRTEWRDVHAGTEDLCQRIQARAVSLAQQLAAATRLELAPGETAVLSGWEPEPATDGAVLTDGPGPDRIASLRIVSGPATVVAWRRSVELSPGNYRLEVRATTRGITPLKSGRTHGASVRVTGADARAGGLVGDHGWETLELEFNVPTGSRPTEFRLELRASSGEVRFAKKSLRLTRRP